MHGRIQAGAVCLSNRYRWSAEAVNNFVSAPKCEVPRCWGNAGEGRDRDGSGSGCRNRTSSLSVPSVHLIPGSGSRDSRSLHCEGNARGTRQFSGEESTISIRLLKALLPCSSMRIWAVDNVVASKNTCVSISSGKLSTGDCGYPQQACICGIGCRICALPVAVPRGWTRSKAYRPGSRSCPQEVVDICMAPHEGMERCGFGEPALDRTCLQPFS